MKKFLAVICAGVLLTGCGGSGSAEKVTKTCSLEQEGIKQDVIMEADGDTVTNAKMNMDIPYSVLETLGVTKEKAESLGEDDKEKLTDQFLELLELNDTDGVTATVTFEDAGMKLAVNMEISTLESLFSATKLSDMITEAEKQGFTCK